MASKTFVVTLTAADTLRHFYDGRMQLCDCWPAEQADAFLHMIADTTYETLLDLVDSFDHSAPLDTEHIPQFADIQQIDCVVETLIGCGESHLSYADLGYYLLRGERKVGAYAKYGENHGKGASLLGLACNTPGRFSCSALSQAYSAFSDPEEKRQLRRKLILRIPLVQDLLYRAKVNRYNGYDSMRMFMLSTMRRRGQSPRKLFGELLESENTILQERIERIYWQE